MPPLRARDDRQALLLGDFTRGHDAACARRIDRDGFFHEHVLARRDRGFEMHRAESRRGGEQDDIHRHRQNFPITIEAVEAMRFRHAVQLAHPDRLFHEHIGDGEHLDFGTDQLGCLHALFQRARAAPAATDQPDLELATRALRPHVEERQDLGGRARHCSALHETPPRNVLRLHGLVPFV